MEMAFSLIMIFVGLHLLAIGYLIRFYKMVEIIAGYGPDKVRDKEGLAKWVGSNLFLMGLMCLSLGGVGLIFPEFIIRPVPIFIAIILIMSFITAIGCKKYEK
ncbi:MAG: DUF3784 domain-containing protein [Candidatus Aenigmarchaeota archaeon]|nr:DUF3784 domain-containing protein [Candidatus Aenigmarchaeota archaeon]